MVKWMWCGSEGSYDDFYLWDIKKVKNSSCNCATALSIFVIIVKFSVTAMHVFCIDSIYKLSISMNMIVEILVTKWPT